MVGPSPEGDRRMCIFSLSHLFDGCYAEDLEPRSYHKSDSLYQRQTRPGQLLVAFDDKTQRRLLAAAVPVGMEGGGQFIEIESNAMGLVGRGGGFDLAWPLGDQADQGKLAGVAQTIEWGAVQPIDHDAGGGCLPLHGAGPCVAILHVPHRVLA